MTSLVHRVTAHNAATQSENKIHDDAVAKAYGFRGGLVPGVTVYAYMTYPVARHWGRAWLEQGTMRARFGAPVYEGQELEVTFDGTDLTATTEDGVVATGTATLPDHPPAPPAVGDYPPGPLPERRPPATAEVLGALDVLGSLDAGFHAERASEFLAEIDDDLPLYPRQQVAHPGYLIRDANWVLAGNVKLGPWIHVESTVVHHSAVVDGERVSTRGKVREVFERKGHGFVVLDLLQVADGRRPVASIVHTAIYRPRRRG